MYKAFDHVAYVVRNIEDGKAALQLPFDHPVVAEVEMPEYSAKVALLATPAGPVELISYADRSLAESRLAGVDVRLDHVGYLVEDIEAAAAQLRAAGARFSAPDGSPLEGPLDYGGARHLLVTPGAAPAVTIQLIERPKEDK